jgi:ABC-2 type transport system permease protein
MDLCRPYDYQGWWGAVAVGKASFYLWARGIPPFLVAAVAFDLRLPSVDRWWIWPAFALAVLLAIGVAFAFRFLVQLVAFWIVDVRGPNQVAWLIGGFLSGMFAPLALFPDGIEPFVRLLPFASMIGLPIEVLLDMHRGTALPAIYLLQAAWLVVLVVLGRVVLARAERKLVIAGG